MRAILMSSNNCNAEYAYDITKEYIKPNMKVVCIPFASELHWQLNGDYTQYKEQHFRVFMDFGIPEENITIAKITDERNILVRKIIESDIIFFSGGYMENFMYLIKQLDLDMIMNYVKHSRLIMGESAGTLVQLDEYIEVPYIEDTYREYKTKEGLGFLNFYNIVVHYDEHNENHQKNKEIVSSMNNKMTICLSDESLMIVDGSVIKLIGNYKI